MMIQQWYSRNWLIYPKPLRQTSLRNHRISADAFDARKVLP